MTTSAATLRDQHLGAAQRLGQPERRRDDGLVPLSTRPIPGTCNDTFGTRVPGSGGVALGSGTTAVAYNYNTNTTSSR